MTASKSKPQFPASTPDERAQWISRYRSSGLTQAQFAQQHGLKLSTLQWWIYGPRRKSQDSATGFREIAVSPLWPNSAWAAELTWPSGMTVRLSARAGTTWIEALLKAVRQEC